MPEKKKQVNKRAAKNRENALEIAEKYGIEQFEPIRSYGRVHYAGKDPARTRIDSRTFIAILPELVRTEYAPLISLWRKKPINAVHNNLDQEDA